MAATKTANVNVRIDVNIKTQAEAILSRIGLPRSVAIDAFYRQIIMHGGIPFPLTIPESKLPACDEMSVSEFDQMMATGIAQAKADDSFDMDEVFEELEAGLNGQMDRYKIRITRQAREQLKEIRRYIEQDLIAPSAAKNTIAAIKLFSDSS